MSVLPRSTIVAVSVLMALSILLVLFGGLPMPNSIFGLAIIWVSAMPGLIFLQRENQQRLPFLAAIGVYYLVFFGLPAFAAPLAIRVGELVVLYDRIVLDAIGVNVLLLVALGIAAMIGGFFVSTGFLFRRLKPFRLPDPNPPANILSILFCLLLAGSLAYRYSTYLQSIPSIGQLLAPAGYLALGGLYLQWHRGCLARSIFWILIVVAIPLELYVRLRYLFLTDLLLVPMFFGFVFWRTRQFKILTSAIFAGSIVLLLYSATGPMRSSAPTLSGKLTAVAAYVTSIFKSERFADTQKRDGENTQYDRRISVLINRIGQIWIFQTVYEQSPEHVPYWYGETYKPLATAIVPRIIYPAKPEERAGGEFGRRYGFTEGGADPSSYNIPWIVELLANFGPLGVVVGMTIFGIMLGALDRFFNGDGMGDLEFVIGLTMIFRLIYQESNFSTMVGSLPILFVSFFVYFSGGTLLLRRVFALPHRS